MKVGLEVLFQGFAFSAFEDQKTNNVMHRVDSSGNNDTASRMLHVTASRLVAGRALPLQHSARHSQLMYVRGLPRTSTWIYGAGAPHASFKTLLAARVSCPVAAGISVTSTTNCWSWTDEPKN